MLLNTNERRWFDRETTGKEGRAVSCLQRKWVEMNRQRAPLFIYKQEVRIALSRIDQGLRDKHGEHACGRRAMGVNVKGRLQNLQDFLQNQLLISNKLAFGF
jgi:hypothetical protein